MWLAQESGAWAKNGLDPEFKLFTTGLELFQAMVGGSLDILSTGAVISNFPARGQGKMFLVNGVEFATAQLWVRDDMGIKTFADLKGKKIATTTGTTAHVFLDTALRANNIDPAKDVELLNQPMAAAVTSFIAGAVPAVALWVPFNVTVRDKVPGAKKLVDASAYYPQAAIVSGWAARNDYYDKNKDVLANVVRAWSAGNDMLIGDGANMAVQIGEQGPFVVDTGAGQLSDKALAAIAKLTPRPVQFVVNTSAHADHTGGNVKFRAAGQDPSLFGSFFSAGRPDAGQGATMIAHQNVQNFMIADNSTNRVPPEAWPTDTILEDRRRKTHNGEGIEMFWMQNAVRSEEHTSELQSH
mgnify:CR=1 FL=1